MAMSDDSSNRDQERNQLRLEWESQEQQPTNNAERAFHGWEILDEHIDLLSVYETGNLFAYDSGIWGDDGEQVLRERAREMMASDYSTSVLRELKDQVRATNSVSIDRLGVPAGKAAVHNGLLDLGTRELRELRPEDHALHRLPVNFDPDGTCPRWRSFLEEVTGDESARRQLQEFVGYCLAGGEPWLKKALMIFGPTDAGKTVFLEIVERLFGEDANAAQTPQYLAGERWGFHQLAGKPVNIRHDIDASRIQSLGILKEIIDGNAVNAEQKGKDPYQLKPKTRLLFAANRAPDRPVDDEAFWNRWLTIVFPRSIPPEEQVDKAKLLKTLEEELPGILNWALDGLDRLRANGGFSAEQSPDEVRRLWEEYGSPVERFKAMRLVKDPEAVVPKPHIQEEFTVFCIDNGYEDISDQKLTQKLTRDPAIGEGQRRINGDRPRVFTGVRLEEEVSDPGVVVEPSDSHVEE